MSMEYIKDSDIKALKKYQYHSIDKSIVTKYILNPYWCWLVKKVPLWVAPNLITLTGFSFMVISMGLLLYYGSNWEEVPRWVYFCWGLFLFFYQSLDAIDGKQARRTGSSGPLGELFDHGCDAINTTLAIVCVLSAFGLGRSDIAVYAIALSLINFYVSSWETYHTHTLFLSYVSGPVEGILSGCAGFIITAFTGPKFWSKNVNEAFGLSLSNHFDLPIYTYVGIAAALMIFSNLVFSMINVYNYTKNNGESLFKKLLGLLPQVGITLLMVAWSRSSSTLISHNLIPFFLFIGFGFGCQVGLIILNHVAKKPFPYWNRVYTFILNAGLISMSITTDFIGLSQSIGLNLPEKLVKVQNYRDAIIDLLKGEGLKSETFERYFLWSLFAVTFFMYMEFALYVINRLCGIFDINCLSIKHPKVINEAAAATADVRPMNLSGSTLLEEESKENMMYTISADGKSKKKIFNNNVNNTADGVPSPLISRRRNRLSGFSARN